MRIPSIYKLVFNISFKIVVSLYQLISRIIKGLTHGTPSVKPNRTDKTILG